MRQTWTYKPKQKETLKLSRSRIELFLECPRCFWLQIRHDLKRPFGPSFLLNQAVDELFKKEFDIYRQKQEPHPLMKKAKLKAIPFKHEKLTDWQDTFKGIQYLVEKHNILIFGGLDDVWINDAEELMVVDYKSTAKNEAVTELYAEGSYHDAYRRQIEIYQWLLKKNDFKVSPIAYFVYANGQKQKPKFNNRLEFAVEVIAYEGQTEWIDGVIDDIKVCLDSDIPSVITKSDNSDQLQCSHCRYVHERLMLGQTLRKNLNSPNPN
ncbi:MAG: PD-(D/E)XK nuclease family protein [Candidatus Saccharibacteria bacterium]|nr:PD-(D/E)XK nuclease family protein [Candidatus Saccharibacteria bacterium]MCY4088514.1 PD-(D/E)XK nuclease family protein [Candidatus Saccharibacteria bacterium]